MHFFDIATILCTGIMAGNEIAVSAFINPALWKLDDRAIASELARTLGKVMPFWYGLSLVLLAIEAYLHRRSTGFPLLVAACILWLGTIIYTLLVLVPINNRIIVSGIVNGDWTPHKKWDLLHRCRIALLIAAVVCMLAALNV
jgi:uncharacterized membrane protein